MNLMLGLQDGPNPFVMAIVAILLSILGIEGCTSF